LNCVDDVGQCHQAKRIDDPSKKQSHTSGLSGSG
jgi:hypothetical protein